MINMTRHEIINNNIGNGKEIMRKRIGRGETVLNEVCQYLR